MSIGSRFKVFPTRGVPGSIETRLLSPFGRASRLAFHAEMEAFHHAEARKRREFMRENIKENYPEFAARWARLLTHSHLLARRHAHARSKFLWSFYGEA